MQETWVRSLGWEDPLEEETAIHSIFLPEKSYGQRSLADCCPWGLKELDRTEHACTYNKGFQVLCRNLNQIQLREDNEFSFVCVLLDSFGISTYTIQHSSILGKKIPD